MSIPAPAQRRKLYRSRKDEKIAGVCGGLAEYLEIDSTIVRLAWLAAALVIGWGIFAYIIAWIVIPNEPEFRPAVASATSPGPNPQPAPNS